MKYLVLHWMLVLALLLAPACGGNDDDDDNTVNDDDTVEPNDDDTDDKPTRLVPRFDDDQLRVGVARADITPEIKETFIDWDKNNRWGDQRPFIDANGNGVWDLDEDMSWDDQNHNGEYDPGEPYLNAEASGDERVIMGTEPYTDTNGNGEFDAVWLFGGGRPANDVHDPMVGSATVLSWNEEYVVLVSLDLVGIVGGRPRSMGEKLSAYGFDPRRLIVNANHDHSSADAIGIGGPSISVTGVDPVYMEWLEDRVVELVQEAVATLEPAHLWAGSMRLRDWDPWVTSVTFGGLNPKEGKQLGLVNDIRDPIIVDDMLRVMQFTRPADSTVIGTWVNWSGHPEISWMDHNLITADYPEWLRGRLDEMYGGLTHFTIADCGGMQSMLGGWVPNYNEQGERVLKEDGTPELLTESGWEFARANGYILAHAVSDLLSSLDEPVAVEGLSVQNREIIIPLDNPLLYAGVITGIIDAPVDLMQDAENCGGEFACAPAHLWAVTIEPEVQIATAPGELLPELFRGLTHDGAEDFDDPRPNRWFPQHRDDNPLYNHANPYAMPPAIAGQMRGKAVNALIGLAESEFGYIVPENDYIFPGIDNDFDHYEETLSLGAKAGTLISENLRELVGNPSADRVPLD